MSDSTVISPKLQNELDAFKEIDDLEGWIYHRITITDAAPSARIRFLMATQEAAWRSYKTYKERIAWMSLLATQGYYQLQTGNILASIAAYEQALQFYESYPLPDLDVVEYVLKPLGNNYTRLADYNTALFIHEKTLAEAMKKNDRPAIASVYGNMAACARWKGELPQAAAFCKKGISYVGQKKLLYGLLLSTYADILAEQQRYDSASILSRQSLDILKGYGKDMVALYWYTSGLQIAARIDLHENNFTGAAKNAKEALQLFDRYAPDLRQREKAKLQVMLGDIERQTGATANSIQSYQRALNLLLPWWQPLHINDLPSSDLFYSENTFGDALAGKAAALAIAGKTDEALSHYIACFDAERKLRRAFFYSASKYRELQVNSSRLNAAMQLAFGAWQKTKSGKYLNIVFHIAELSKAQVLIDERNARLEPTDRQPSSDTTYQKIKQLQEAINYYEHELVQADNKNEINTLLQSAEHELSVLTTEYKRASYEDQDAITIDELLDMLKKLPEGVSLIEFFEGSDSSYIIEANKTGVKAARCIGSSKTLHSTIQQFIQEWFSGAAALQNAPAKFSKQSFALYKSIFGDYTWNADQWYVFIPDGIFSYLPFDALLTKESKGNIFGDWPWLTRQGGFSQAWSLPTWYEQQESKHEAGYFYGFFVEGTKASKQAKLSVEKEYNALKKQVEGEFYLNQYATWSKFNTAAEQATVLHIGSHAMTIRGDSLPYLLLYDKPFYLFDLRYKTFEPALVVLGACRTGNGILLEGEGVNSLSRGFTAAGAGGVFSGLWNVNDETAIEFMQLYYHYLAGNNPAKALRLAKLQWLTDHSGKPALQMPYYWSGFIYSGHLQPINLLSPAERKPGRLLPRYRVPLYVRIIFLLIVLTVVILFRFIQSGSKQKR